MEILMAGSEMFPFAKTGGLADVMGALPLALRELGMKVSVMLPCYRGVEAESEPEPTGVKVRVPILEGEQWRDREGEILRAVIGDGVDVYLVKMDEYYNRETLYGPPDGDYPDNCARFTFFCRAALQFLKAKSWRPDLIHVHDWQTALIPVYLKTVYRSDADLGGVPTALTIHNIGYQGLFWRWDMKLIGLPWEYFTPESLEYYGQSTSSRAASFSPTSSPP